MKKQFFLFPILLVLYELPIYFSNNGYLPAVSNIMQDLASSQQLVLLSITVWFFITPILQLMLGPITEHYGRRPALLWGGVLFVISSGACAITTNIYLLLIARFIQGSAVATMTVPGYATLHDLYDQKTAIAILSWVYSFSLLGTALASLFGSFVLHVSSWRYIFVIMMVWGAIVLIPLYLKMPETSKITKDLNLKTSLMTYKLLLTNLNYLKPTIGFCFLISVFVAWTTVSPFFIIIEKNNTQLAFGIVQALVFSSYIVGAQAVRALSKKYDMNLLSKMGMSFALIGGISVLLLPWLFSESLVSLTLPMMMILGATGFSAPILNRFSIDASNQPMGSRIAMLYFLVNGFALIGSTLISASYNGTVWSFSIIIFVLTLLAFIIISRI